MSKPRGNERNGFETAAYDIYAEASEMPGASHISAVATTVLLVPELSVEFVGLLLGDEAVDWVVNSVSAALLTKEAVA